MSKAGMAVLAMCVMGAMAAVAGIATRSIPVLQVAAQAAPPAGALRMNGSHPLVPPAQLRLAGEVMPLAPGDALFVPYRWPHWVTVGDEPSISLSFTWNSRAGFEQNDAFRLNAWLRRFGLSPGSPAPLPARSAVRSVAWRALSRLHLA